MTAISKTSQELKFEYPTFPDVRHVLNKVNDGIYITFETLVRIQREGVYYLVLSRNQYMYHEDKYCFESGLEASTLYINQVYQIQNFFKVDNDWSVKDDNQLSEPDRLIEADPILRLISK